MSAFGGKADMTVCGSPLLRSLSGVKRTCRCAAHMSAFDPKRTLAAAFGGKADMTVCGCLLLRSLLGAKRTSLFAAHMSAYDPKRTLDHGQDRYYRNSGTRSC